MAYALSWHDRADELPAELWAAGFAPPREGLWWYRALEQSGLEEQFRFMYALVRDDQGRPLAIAPAFLMDVALEMFVPGPLQPVVRVLARAFPSLLHQRTLFVGSPCSDAGWVGIVPGADRLAALRCVHAGVMAKAREVGAPMRVWKDFPEAFDAELDALAREQGLFRVVSFPGTEVRLADASKDGYYRAMPGSGAERLKRNVRRSMREVDLETSVVTGPDAATLDEIHALFQQTYERATTRFERLDRTFFGQMAQGPRSRFILVRHRQDRRLVAFMLCFDLGSTLVNKFVGFDYARPREWRLYFRLWDAFVDLAVALGKARVESGQTGYAGKLAVGHCLLPLTNYCHHAHPLLRRVYRLVGAQVTWQSLDADLAEHFARRSSGKHPRGTTATDVAVAGR